jgi:hypothetical protein
MLEALRRFYTALFLQEDLEAEQRALSLVGRFQQVRDLAVPILLLSLVFNGISMVAVRELGKPAEGWLRGLVGAPGLIGAAVLSLALFLLVGSFHLRAGLWFGIYHVATGYAALATTLTHSNSIYLYLWMGFLLGMSTSFCFGWTRAWYQVGLSYLVILLFGTWHVIRLPPPRGENTVPFVQESLRFLLPNVAGFFIGLYSFQGYVAWGIFASVIFLISVIIPAQAPALLKWGPVHLDNTLQFPLPFLYRHLLLAYERDPAAALQEVQFILQKRPYQRKVARAALDRFLLLSLRRVHRPEDLARLRATGLLREPWHRQASADMRAFVEEVVRDGSGVQGISAGSLRRLDELTEEWSQGDGKGEELRKELRTIANRWMRWDMEESLQPAGDPAPTATARDLPAAAPAPGAVAEPQPGWPPRERIRKALEESFNKAELEEIVFDLGHDWENLAGERKNEKIVDFLLLLERRQEMPMLLDKAESLHPGFRSNLYGPS